MIVVLGSINIDMRFEVDSLPGAGETIHARNRAQFGGGKGANQVLAASRAGADAAFFGAVGSDQAAEFALSHLVEAGVDTSKVASVEDDTGSAVIYVDRQGENCIVVAAGANASVDIEMAAAAVSHARDGFLVLQQEIPVATTIAALELARLHDVRTIVNVSPFDGMSSALSQLADIVIANQHEWAGLAGREDTAAAMKEWSRRQQKTVVVTRGAGGVAIASPSEYFEVAAPSIRPVDTVGAGDTFCGYFVAELDRGGSLRQAAEIAVLAASVACMKAGAQSSIPLRHSVLNTLDRYSAG
jgi:ribokinase